MERLAARAKLPNLSPASETVGDNRRCRQTRIDSGQQYTFADRAREFEPVLAVTKRASHAATARIRRFDFEIRSAAKQRDFARHPRQGLAMTVAMHQRVAAYLRR